MRKSKSFTLVCGTKDNWYWNISVRIRNDGTFKNKGEILIYDKEAQKESAKKCYHKNLELSRAYVRNWRLDNANGDQAIRERYRNSEKGKETERKYKEINRALYRKSQKKHRAKKRGWDFIELNIPFQNSHGHHINSEFVLYVPSKLHNSVSHNLDTGEGMVEINTKAFLWLVIQEDLFLF